MKDKIYRKPRIARNEIRARKDDVSDLREARPTYRSL